MQKFLSRRGVVSLVINAKNFLQLASHFYNHGELALARSPSLMDKRYTVEHRLPKKNPLSGLDRVPYAVCGPTFKF